MFSVVFAMILTLSLIVVTDAYRIWWLYRVFRCCVHCGYSVYTTHCRMRDLYRRKMMKAMDRHSLFTQNAGRGVEEIVKRAEMSALKDIDKRVTQATDTLTWTHAKRDDTGRLSRD